MIDSTITIRVVGRSSSSGEAPQLTLRPAFLAIANRCYVQSDPTGPLLFFRIPSTTKRSTRSCFFSNDGADSQFDVGGLARRL